MAMIHYNFDNMNLQQQFSLPKPIMAYIIMKPSNAKVYQKLIQTCKYIYYKNPAVLVNGSAWYDRSELSFFKNFFENDPSGIHFGSLWRLLKNAKNSLSTAFLQNLQCCNLADLCIFDQTLTFNEFKMLTKFGTISNFSMKNVTFQYENGTYVPVECIIEELLNVVTFKVDELFTAAQSAFSPETFQKLAALPSFQNLEIFRIHAPLRQNDFNYLIEFLKKNNNNRCIFVFLIPLLNTTDIAWLLNLKASVYDLTEFGQPLEYQCKLLFNKVYHYAQFAIERLIDEI